MDNTSIAVPKDMYQNYKTKCELLGVKPTDMFRELIQAFTEDRITITPTLQQRELSKTYGRGQTTV